MMVAESLVELVLRRDKLKSSMLNGKGNGEGEYDEDEGRHKNDGNGSSSDGISVSMGQSNLYRYRFVITNRCADASRYEGWEKVAQGIDMKPIVAQGIDMKPIESTVELTPIGNVGCASGFEEKGAMQK
ncbi:hypothetical protein J1N35_019620 [Gossypium stocksii]|uniref:Uncharacterized protein n=1 Tax=Gossypium stocksii TaxID=47602 RepID=A0A9D4A7S0_9ROSI|nr:hypothetical protein J1N35_019620 [Gossypium stocksii]